VVIPMTSRALTNWHSSYFPKNRTLARWMKLGEGREFIIKDYLRGFAGSVTVNAPSLAFASTNW